MMLFLIPTGIGLNGTMVKKKEKKRSMKIAIMTHFVRIQQIDQFPSLLNKSKDYGYSLGSHFDHDLKYVPMNWKRKMEMTIKKYRSEIGTKLQDLKNKFMVTR